MSKERVDGGDPYMYIGWYDGWQVFDYGDSPDFGEHGGIVYIRADLAGLPEELVERLRDERDRWEQEALTGAGLPDELASRLYAIALMNTAEREELLADILAWHEQQNGGER